MNTGIFGWNQMHMWQTGAMGFPVHKENSGAIAAMKKTRKKTNKKAKPHVQMPKAEPDTPAEALSQENAVLGEAEKPAAAAKSAAAAKPEDTGMNLQEAVVWSEILGEPVCRKNRRRRRARSYGNRGYAGRG